MAATNPSTSSCSSSSPLSSNSNEITNQDLQDAYLFGKENDYEISQAVLRDKGWPTSKILNVFNRLAEARVCVLRKTKNGQPMIWCKIRKEDVIQKLKQLDSNDYRVYCVIEEAANAGIWTADIRKLSGLQTHQIQKAVKQLVEVKRLIKPVKNIHVKNRKVYMLAELEPCKEVAGGTFYINGDFNEHLVEHLRDQISHYLMNGQNASLPVLAAYVRTSGELRAEVSDDDISSVIRTLELEQKVFKIVVPSTRETQYSWCKWPSIYPFKNIPCGTCPVFSECHSAKGSKVSPQNCEYMSEWLGYDFEVPLKDQF